MFWQSNLTLYVEKNNLNVFHKASQSQVVFIFPLVGQMRVTKMFQMSSTQRIITMSWMYVFLPIVWGKILIANIYLIFNIHKLYMLYSRPNILFNKNF